MLEEVNWNESDKSRIKEEAFKKFQKDMEKYYSDVKFPQSEPEKFIDETLKEINI